MNLGSNRQIWIQAHPDLLVPQIPLLPPPPQLARGQSQGNLLLFETVCFDFSEIMLCFLLLHCGKKQMWSCNWHPCCTPTALSDPTSGAEALLLAYLQFWAKCSPLHICWLNFLKHITHVLHSIFLKQKIIRTWGNTYVTVSLEKRGLQNWILTELYTMRQSNYTQEKKKEIYTPIYPCFSLATGAWMPFPPCFCSYAFL